MRWRDHNARRRAAVVNAAVVVIDHLGPAASAERIAAAAGIHRTVLYRYFADRDDLDSAIAGAVADTIRRNVLAELDFGRGVTPRQVIESTVTAFVESVVGHRNLYRFLVAYGGEARLIGIRVSVADRLTAMLDEIVAGAQIATDLVQPTAYGAIGIVELTLSWWIQHPEIPRARVVELLTTNIAHLLEGTARDIGLDIAFDVPFTAAS